MFIMEYILPVLSGFASLGFAIFILSKFLYKKARFGPVIISILIIVSTAIMCLVNTLQLAWLNIVSGYAVFTVINSVLFKGSFTVKLGLAVIITTINAVSEMFLFFLVLIITELRLIDIAGNTVAAIIISFLTIIAFAVLGRILFLKFPRRFESFRISEMFLIFFQVLATGMLYIIGEFSGGAQISFSVNLLILLFQMALLMSSVLIFFIFDSALHKQELEKQIEIYQYQFEQIKESQAVVGRIEHDIEKHLLALKLDLKNAMPNQAEQKIDALIGNLRLAENVADSGNANVDAILNYKAMQASAFGIRMTCDLRLPYSLSINTTDLAVILGNAIDNAIEACGAVDQSEREVFVSISYEKPNLRMSISNPYTGEIKTDADGSPATTKAKGRHGIGLKSIREAVERYDGLIDITTADNRFLLKIMMFNLKGREDRRGRSSL